MFKGKAILFGFGFLLLFNLGLVFASTLVFEGLLDEEVGFGSNVTGGAGGEICRVTNLNDSGDGSLRSCVERFGKIWVVFDVSGVINLDSDIKVQSDKTIDGRGAEIILERQGLVLSKVSNVIIHNIYIRDGVDDAVKIIDGTNGVWIDHITLSNFTDGLIDITRSATDVTISWSKFENHTKTILIGADEADVGDEVIRVTMHHNFFNGVEGRTPRLRYGKVHSYNNLFYHWGYGASASHALGELYSENNIYEAKTDLHPAILADDNPPWDSQVGYARDTGSWFLNNASTRGTGLIIGDVFNPEDYYDYTAENANIFLRQKIIANSGRQKTLKINSEPIIITSSDFTEHKKSFLGIFLNILVFGLIVAFIYFKKFRK